MNVIDYIGNQAMFVSLIWNLEAFIADDTLTYLYRFDER